MDGLGWTLQVVFGSVNTALFWRANRDTVTLSSGELRTLGGVTLFVSIAAIAWLIAGYLDLDGRVVGLTAIHVNNLVVLGGVETFHWQRGRRHEEEVQLRMTEVERLNRQLSGTVRQRSTELAAALARLIDQGTQSAVDLLPGTLLDGRFAISRPLGQGGMGAVYRAHDVLADQDVAVKVVLHSSQADPAQLRYFLQEAQAVATVEHPAVVRAHHVDVSEDGVLYVVIDLLDGVSLDRRLAQGPPLPLPLIARLGHALADGLDAVHHAGVVHRDLKPANIMLVRQPPYARLLDFGIAKLRQDDAVASGQTQFVMGTPTHIAPEAITAPASVAGPADVYGLGVVLYQCIAGRLPYDDVHIQALLAAQRRTPPPSLPAHVPVEMRSCIERCLANDPSARPTAAEVREVLATMLEPLRDDDVEALVQVPPHQQGSPLDTNETLQRASSAHTTYGFVDDVPSG